MSYRHFRRRHELTAVELLIIIWLIVTVLNIAFDVRPKAQTVNVGATPAGAKVIPGQRTTFDWGFNGRTLIVADSKKKTLTLVPGDQGSDLWLCAQHEHGKACQTVASVNYWLLENGAEER